VLGDDQHGNEQEHPALGIAQGLLGAHAAVGHPQGQQAFQQKQVAEQGERKIEHAIERIDDQRDPDGAPGQAGHRQGMPVAANEIGAQQ
jgi:hypothetical protein